MKSTHIAASAVVLALLLGGCGSTKESDTTTSGSARLGVRYSLQILEDVSKNRPTAPLGLFASMFLSQGGYFPISSAVQGVHAQLTFQRPINPDQMDDAFQLLQEYGGVLGVDVPDLLNRSSDRSGALNEYIDGLTNITKRAKQKTADINDAVAARNDILRTQSRESSDIQSRIRKAFSADDYATAGALQQDATIAEGKVNKTQSDINRLRDIQRIFEQLNDLSDRRLQAITQNREILIAGLQVVDVPGIEDLRLIKNPETGQYRFGTSGFSL